MSKWDGKDGLKAPPWMITTQAVMAGLALIATPIFLVAMVLSLNPVGVVIALVELGVTWAAVKTSLQDELRSLLVAQGVLFAAMGLTLYVAM